MGRRRKGGHRKKEDESDYDSDDPRAYAKEKAPDPSSQDYIYDEVDEFHASKEKISLDVGRALEPADSSDNEEEVLGWDDEDDEEDAILEERLKRFRRQEKMDEMASDLEDEEEDDEGDEEGEAISAKAWGKRKQAYYDTDYVDDDLPGLDQLEEAANQEAEEKEALAIQTRMAEALQDDDFGLDIFKSSDKQPEKTTTDDLDAEEKVAKDLSKLSKREKLELLKKESPEFLQLTADFKIKMRELIDQLQPLVALIKKGAIPEGSEGARYIHTKYQLYLSYCMNISFYTILKAKHVPVANHPVIGRILAFGKLISELKPVDEKLKEEIEAVLSRAEELGKENKAAEAVENDEEEVLPEARKMDKKKKKKRKQEDAVLVESESALPMKKKKKGLPSLSEEELKALEYYKAVESKQREKKKQELALMGDLEDDNEEEEEEEEDGDEKRGITYQISKNKGLTAYRRKELKNPRVKNRMKFRKAKIRRKGQVREARTELHRYSGEASGIRAGVIKSVKIR